MDHGVAGGMGERLRIGLRFIMTLAFLAAPAMVLAANPSGDAAVRQLSAFKPEEPWNINGPGELFSVDKNKDQNATIITLQPSSKEFALDISKPDSSFNNPDVLTLNINLLNGEGVGVAACFANQNGEEFAFPNTPLKAGENTITWRFKDQISGWWGAKGDKKITGSIQMTRLLIIRWPQQQAAKVRLVGLSVSERHLAVDSVSVAFDAGMSRPVVIKQYKVMSPNHSNEWHDPADWKLQGSNDKKQWTDLDARSGQTFSERRQVKTYDIPNNNTPYAHFRLLITAAAKASGAAGLAELMLLAPSDKGVLEPVTDCGTSWASYYGSPYQEHYRVFDNNSRSHWIAGLKPEGTWIAFSPTTSPVPYVLPNKAEQASYVITNNSKKAAEFKMTLRAVGTEDQTVTREMTVQLPPESSQSVKLPNDLAARKGVIRLNWKLTDSDGGSVSGQNRLAVMEPAGRGEAHRKYFLFGNGGTEQLQMLSQIGIDVIRMSDEWHYNTGPDGKHDWSDYDRQIEQANRHGLRKQWLMAYTPTWAIPKDYKGPQGDWWKGSAPITSEAFRMYTRDLATRYKGQIDYYEVRNEVDLDGFWRGSTELYLELQKIAWEEIKKIDPKAKVLTSGFATLTGHGGRNLNPDIHERTMKEAQNYFDYHAFHQHGDFFEVFQPIVDGELARIRKHLKDPAAKPVFYTETSVCSDPSWNSQVVQGDELIKKVVFAWARGAYAYEWFAALDWKDGEMWGLCTWDHQAKPAYLAYNNLIKQLRGLTPQRQLTLSADQYAFVFADPEKKSSRQVVVFWRENNRLPDADLRLNVGPNAVCTLIDPYGNTTPQPVLGGQTPIALRQHPAYLLIDNGTPVTETAPLAVPATLASFDTGKTLKLTTEVGNPSGAPRAMTLTWQLPPEFKGVASIPPQTVTLAPGAKQLVAGETALPADLRMPSFGILHAKLTYALDSQWQGSLLLPLQLARLIPSEDPATRPADFTMNTKDSIINYFYADPANADKEWKGPADLSAKVWLSHANDTLTIKVDVTDDIHDQPFMGGDTWKADGIQLAFVVPNQKGFWELGLYQAGHGKPMAHVFMMPENTGLANPWDKIQLTLTPRSGGMIYEAKLKDADFGLTSALLAQGIRFNLIINDADGKGIREGYVQIADGIGGSKSTEKFPVVRFKK